MAQKGTEYFGWSAILTLAATGILTFYWGWAVAKLPFLFVFAFFVFGFLVISIRLIVTGAAFPNKGEKSTAKSQLQRLTARLEAHTQAASVQNELEKRSANPPAPQKPRQYEGGGTLPGAQGDRLDRD
jgi:hypothetical protein